MIAEFLNFAQKLDNNIKLKSESLSDGIHLFLKQGINKEMVVSDCIVSLKSNILLGQEKVSKAIFYEKNSKYLSMNQQQKFDKLQKVHSANPFCFAFNFSLGSKKKEIEAEISLKIDNKAKPREFKRAIQEYKINQVIERTDDYFFNAKKLCLDSDQTEFDLIIECFSNFCKKNLRKFLFEGCHDLEFSIVEFMDRLEDKNYIKLYLEEIKDGNWQKAYEKYYSSEYPLNDLVENDFLTTYNSKKLFNKHNSATFETNLTLKGGDLKILKELEGMFKAKPKMLPNPLPIFIYDDELQSKFISIYNDNNALSYQGIISSLLTNHKMDISNYYLVNWFTTKQLNISDFDFVSKFEYEVEAQIINFFDIKEKDSQNPKHYPKITNVFEFEQQVFKQLLQNKYLKLDYFNDLSKDDYEKKDMTFISYSKYRKAVYDFVYKSQRESVDGNIFNEMVFNAIKDDLKQGNEYGIKEKLNLWYSLFEFFNPNKNKDTMANELQSYQHFVDSLINETSLSENIIDEQFAFAAGQVIYYILEKSKSADNSYQLLEPYLQKAKCSEFKQVIANDFARYKHEKFSKNFERVAAFVLSYETNANIKHLLPAILSGVFAKNQLFSNKPQ